MRCLTDPPQKAQEIKQFSISKQGEIVTMLLRDGRFIDEQTLQFNQ